MSPPETTYDLKDTEQEGGGAAGSCWCVAKAMPLAPGVWPTVPVAE